MNKINKNMNFIQKRKKLFYNIAIGVSLFLIVTIICAAIIGNIENWSFLDAFYMSVMTGTTIGYGDFVPTTNAGKMFISFYSLLSIGTFFYIFTLIAVANVEHDIK
jgi:voltage-gated potassium channel